MNIVKHTQNPLIKIKDVKPSREDFEIIGVFNAGVATYNNDTILLLRIAEKPINTDTSKYLCPIYDTKMNSLTIKVFDRNDCNYNFDDPRVIRSKYGENYLTSISHIRFAHSKDGVNFEIDEHPLIQAFDLYTSFGVEDPRITQIDDMYYVNFSAASNVGIITRLFSTKDFKTFDDLGNIFHPDNKDVTIFPIKIGDKYYAFHRPSTSEYAKPNMWLASSNDLIHWGDNRVVATVRNGYWDNGRIGASCVPFLTEKGWLAIYHGATKENRYCLGAMLLDKEQPWKIIKRSETPLVEPTEKYELDGFFGNVVFSCGLTNKEGTLKIYYGAADDSVCLIEMQINDIFNHLGL